MIVGLAIHPVDNDAANLDALFRGNEGVVVGQDGGQFLGIDFPFALAEGKPDAIAAIARLAHELSSPLLVLGLSRGTRSVGGSVEVIRSPADAGDVGSPVGLQAGRLRRR